MSKTYSQMTPAERIADRIAKNRAIDAKVQSATPVSAPKRTYTPEQILRSLTPEQIASAQAVIASGQPIRKVVEVRCWNRTILLLPSQVDAIVNALTVKLAKWEQAGSKRTVHGQEGWSTVSVQTAINYIRDTTRVNFPTNHGEAQDILKALGFQLERLSDGHTTIVIGYKEELND